MNGPVPTSPVASAHGCSSVATWNCTSPWEECAIGAMWYSPFQTSSYISRPSSRRRSIRAASSGGGGPSTTVRTGVSVPVARGP